jgi:tetratricopeptide (TPR) repeat protein
MNKWTQPLDWSRPARADGGRRSVPAAHHYFAFLSYSHEDTATADWLHQELERFRVPATLAGKLTANGVIPKRLTPIFRDRHELPASEDLGAEIRQALELSRCLIVLCSPAAAKSKWTNAEIDTFKRLHPDGCIIAAVIAGEPLASDIPGRENEECFPPALVAKYNRRGKPTGEKSEPLAADLREGKGGKRTGFLKVVAGILGVGLDDLVQRDHLRRQRRMATITGASLLGMFVALALAVIAIQARDAARDQRREAEGLVSFMLGDLKDKLEPIGRLDALDGVGSKVLDYYSKQDTSQLSDAGLLQRSRALSLMAQVAYLRGDMPKAQKLYREAIDGTAEAVARSPDDPRRLYEHAQNVFWIGELARKQGQMSEAESAYLEYKKLANRMAAIEPDNLKWRMESAYGDVNVGIVYRNERRFADAARQFSGALGVMERVASLDPGTTEYQASLANLLGWTADAERDRGFPASAIVIRQRQLAFLHQQIARHPSNVEFKVRLIPAHEGLGILLSATRGPGSGLDELRQAVAEAEQLIPVERDNSYWKALGAQARLDLAQTLLEVNQTQEAQAQASGGCGLAEQVLSRDSGPTWRHLRTTCLMVRAKLALKAGENQQSIAFAQQALEAARKESSSDPTTDRYTIGAVYRLIGDIRQRMGNGEAAKAAWAAGLAQLPRNAPERPAEMDERAQLLGRLGRTAEARPLTESLKKMGYGRTV